MRCLLAVLLIVLRVILINGAVIYCGAKMCGHSNVHTFCQFKPGPGAFCRGYMEAELSKEEKTQILNRLNRRRSDAARGSEYWPSAGDMLKLRWVEDLAREAQLWADQCTPAASPEEHDVCRDLYSISVGQCVASIVGEAPGLRPESMVDMWYMQKLIYGGNVTSYIPPYHRRFYGDFAQMIWSRTHMVGCARSRFMTDWRGRLRSVERLVCNFAPRGPVPSRPLWTPADPASLCPLRSHSDTEFPELCAYQIDVHELKDNKSNMSIEDNYVLETIFEIEKNESLNYLGSLDELYLTKMVIPVNYNLQKKDYEKIEDYHGIMVDSRSEMKNINKSNINLSTVKGMFTIKTDIFTSKINEIERTKPYDIYEVSDPIVQQIVKNLTKNQDTKRDIDNEMYAEYGLFETEDAFQKTSTTLGNLIEMFHYVNELSELITQRIDNSEPNKVTDRLAQIDNRLKESTDVDGTFYYRNAEYFSDPETVRELQETVDRVEHTLASPNLVSTPGKVRRELRSKEVDLKKTKQQLHTDPTPVIETSIGNKKKDDNNKSRDKARMLSMVLRYLPYLKPYEKSIIDETSNDFDSTHFALSIIVFSVVINVFVG